MQFRRKRTLTNPKKGKRERSILECAVLDVCGAGPFHHRAPSAQFYRTVRGMLPHKLPRGAAALASLKVSRCKVFEALGRSHGVGEQVFDGCPAPYDKVKKMVVPEALRALRLAPGHRYCRLVLCVLAPV
jgi:hypothetical protein